MKKRLSTFFHTMRLPFPLSLLSPKVKMGLGILIFSFLYSLLRYNVIAGVSWGQVSLFIINKAVAMSAVLLLAGAAWGACQHPGDDSRWWGMLALHYAFMHILLTLILLPGDYYPTFYLDPLLNFDRRFSIVGGFCLLMGAISSYLFFSLSSFRQVSLIVKHNLLLLMSCSLALHLAFLGLQSWLIPSAWPGYIPPISLVCFITTLFLFFYYLKTHPLYSV
ncbi:hypothetical protein JYU12_01175 [bacterium AH-315-K03]|nr:hypothetical protein [bacterium AH-315-K03]